MIQNGMYADCCVLGATLCRALCFSIRAYLVHVDYTCGAALEEDRLL